VSDSHRFIRLADRLLSRLSRPEELAASDEDIYLSPHCDDIAFSIGYFARARSKGRLVTVFTRSNFTLQPGLGDLSVDQVTALRTQEEKHFAARAGLTLVDFGLPEAPLRGFKAMDPSPADQQAAVIGPLFLPKLLALGRLQRQRQRPWLFVPMAMGGHLDHAIVLKAILGHRRALGRFFRLAFYEDLPYAAWINERSNGMAMFHRMRPLLGWRRLVFPLGSGLHEKLKLIALYESQHRVAPDIAAFTPECHPPLPPHEAVWVWGRP
jgi:LmbE family N-acetylglucosaminyl deacetylase